MFVSFHTLIAPSLLNFQYVDITVILESNKKELAINISDILPRDVSCRIDCNFPGCDSNIAVKRDSQLYRIIRPRESIFENRAVERSDGGTYVCIVGTRVSGNNFKLIIYRKSKSFNSFVFTIDLVNVWKLIHIEVYRSITDIRLLKTCYGILWRSFNNNNYTSKSSFNYAEEMNSNSKPKKKINLNQWILINQNEIFTSTNIIPSVSYGTL